MKYCSECGHTVTHKIPDHDDRLRYVCEHCNTIHYQNPRVVVGCLPVWQDKVLLCRRAIEPRYGYWTLPAGFMENGETSCEGAKRETWEEALAKVEDLQLYRLFDLPHISQIYMFYRASLVAEEFAAGAESLEVALFDEDDIPWPQLAFPVVADTLRDFFADRRHGVFDVTISNAFPVKRS